MAKAKKSSAPRVVVLMGVAGSGKTTVGRELERRLGWEFLDADDFHSPEAVAKMAGGTPLDDADREPWLARLSAEIRRRVAGGSRVVLACSALKERYRRVLAEADRDVGFVLLEVPREILERRLAERGGHFFNRELLDSQLETLEAGGDVLTVDASLPPERVASAVLQAVEAPQRGGGRRAWIDVSVPLRTGMVTWPGNPAVSIDRTMDLARGDECTVSALAMGAHTGTHMDAPCHFLAGAPSLDALPFDATVGLARVIAIEDPDAITVRELRRHRIRRGERILFRTRNSERCWRTDEFLPDFVHISVPAARFLAVRGIRLVGIDYLSVGGTRDGKETHLPLLGAGVWILEGLDLSRVSPGPVDLVCLPLRIAGAEGAPARAIVRERRR